MNVSLERLNILQLPLENVKNLTHPPGVTVPCSYIWLIDYETSTFRAFNEFLAIKLVK